TSNPSGSTAESSGLMPGLNSLPAGTFELAETSSINGSTAIQNSSPTGKSAPRDSSVLDLSTAAENSLETGTSGPVAVRKFNKLVPMQISAPASAVAPISSTSLNDRALGQNSVQAAPRASARYS